MRERERGKNVNKQNELLIGCHDVIMKDALIQVRNTLYPPMRTHRYYMHAYLSTHTLKQLPKSFHLMDHQFAHFSLQCLPRRRNKKKNKL